MQQPPHQPQPPSKDAAQQPPPQQPPPQQPPQQQYQAQQYAAPRPPPQQASSGRRTVVVTGGAPDANASNRSQLVALVLCAFLGVFGEHRCYVGKFCTRVIWLLTGGVFFIGWFIDTVMILLGSFEDEHGRKVNDVI